MSHDVFISHSSLDKLAADAICHGLEAKGIRCWIAPRDQVAGRPYGQQITSAIEEAQVMVLVFSDHVNQSQAVLNEINVAAGANVTIVPFRIASVEFGPELHFYLGRMHWLDAFPQPVDAYIDTLADTVRRNLKTPAPAGVAAVAGVVEPPPAPPPPPPAPPPPPPAPPPPPPAPPPPPPAGAAALGGVAATATLGAGPKTDMRPLMIAGGVFGVIAFIVLIFAILPHPAPAPANTLTPAASNALAQLGPNNAMPPNNGLQLPNTGTTTNTDPDSAPPLGNGSETQVVNNADPNAVSQYETEVIDGGPPSTLAGATVINTSQLAQVMAARDQGHATFWLVDARACSGEVSIPTAVCFTNPEANSAPDIGAEMSDIMSGIPDKSTNLIVFCHDGGCPMSYNLATAMIQAGYQHVYWFRGGINAWQSAGLPTVNSAQTGP